MVKHGEIKKIAKGFYSSYDDPTLAVFCFKPAYLGLQEALSIHNLWEQETNAIILTTRKVRTGTRVIFWNNVLIKKIKPEYFFGFEYKKYGDFYVPVSDIEKTFIDLVYFDQPMDKDLLRNLRKKINKERLKQYLRDYDMKTRKKIEKMLR